MNVAVGHESRLSQLGSISTITIGSALGDPTDAEDERYARAVECAIDAGVTVVDTAINYRCQRSERVIGNVVRALPQSRRPIICTKGGYLPLEAPPPESKEEYRAYIKREYIDSGIVEPDDLVAGGHCISPAFLRDQINRSRTNLGLDTIDLYMLHTPEQQLTGVDRPEFERRMRLAFQALESAADDGHIRAYGCATWNGTRVEQGAANHLSLEWLDTLARELAGDRTRFAAVQIPVNLAMTEAIRTPTQRVGNRDCGAIDAAAALGISVVAIAPLMQGRLVTLPPAAREALPDAPSDAARALAFVRMIPNIETIVVGMRSVDHVTENVATFTS